MPTLTAASIVKLHFNFSTDWYFLVQHEFGGVIRCLTDKKFKILPNQQEVKEWLEEELPDEYKWAQHWLLVQLEQEYVRALNIESDSNT